MREMSSEDRHAKALSRAILTVWIFFGVSYPTRAHQLLGEQVAPRSATGASEPESRTTEAKYDGKTIAEWITLLEADDANIRGTAYKALARIGAPALPALVEEAFNGKDAQARQLASQAACVPREELRKVAAEVVPAVAQRLLDKDDRLRHRAVLLLWSFGPERKEALPVFVKALKDKDKEVRDAAVGAFSQMGDEAKPAVPDIVTLLDDKDLGVRLSASYVLLELGPVAKTAVPRLAAIVGATSEDREIRLAAARALGRIGPDVKTAVPGLVEVLRRDRDHKVRAAAASALGNAGVAGAKTVIPALMESLEDADPDVRSSAAVSVGQAAHFVAGTDGDVKAVITALANRLRAANRHDDQKIFASALAAVGPPAVPTLMELLGESEERRLAALRGFAFVKPDDAKPAVGALTRLLSDRNPEIRGNAAAALGAIGSAAVSALPALERMARDDPDFRDHDTRRTAGGAVERIKEDNSKE